MPLWLIDSRQDDILVSSYDECFQGTEPRPAINLSWGWEGLGRGETSL